MPDPLPDNKPRRTFKSPLAVLAASFALGIVWAHSFGATLGVHWILVSAVACILVGLILEALKYVNLAIAPYLQAKLEHEYFIFRHSVAILLWSFIAAMVVLAGAEWTARPKPEDSLS